MRLSKRIIPAARVMIFSAHESRPSLLSNAISRNAELRVSVALATTPEQVAALLKTQVFDLFVIEEDTMGVVSIDELMKLIGPSTQRQIIALLSPWSSTRSEELKALGATIVLDGGQEHFYETVQSITAWLEVHRQDEDRLPLSTTAWVGLISLSIMIILALLALLLKL
jgi:hypothetical protein